MGDGEQRRRIPTSAEIRNVLNGLSTLCPQAPSAIGRLGACGQSVDNPHINRVHKIAEARKQFVMTITGQTGACITRFTQWFEETDRVVEE